MDLDDWNCNDRRRPYTIQGPGQGHWQILTVVTLTALVVLSTLAMCVGPSLHDPSLGSTPDLGPWETVLANHTRCEPQVPFRPYASPTTFSWVPSRPSEGGVRSRETGVRSVLDSPEGGVRSRELSLRSVNVFGLDTACFGLWAVVELSSALPDLRRPCVDVGEGLRSARGQRGRRGRGGGTGCVI